MNPTDVPIIDIEMFKGTAFSLTYNCTQEGSPYPLTNKTVVVGFTGIFSADLTLNSSDGPTPLGSFADVSDPSGGVFQILLHESETATIINPDGYYYILLREAGQADIVLVRGSVHVISLSKTGAL